MVRDSGLTDSKFMKVQKYIQNKHTKYVEEYGKEAEIEKMKNRFESSVKKPANKKTSWGKIMDFFK